MTYLPTYLPIQKHTYNATIADLRVQLEEENKHLKERLNEYSLRFSQYESKLSDKDKDIKLLQDQLLKTNTQTLASEI